MSALERTVDSFQDLVGQVPEIVQPLVVGLAAGVPFVEGEGGAVIGVVGGLHPVVVAVAAATGNFLCVLLVVAVTSRARTAVVDRHSTLVGVGGGGSREGLDEQAVRTTVGRAGSKRRQRFDRWLVRYGVPGASVLGPLAVPTQFTSAVLVGAGIPPRRVLLWQAVAIAVWTTVATVSVWAALTYAVGS